MGGTYRENGAHVRDRWMAVWERGRGWGALWGFKWVGRKSFRLETGFMSNFNGSMDDND